ncbi:glutamate-5-semialdehyde dehydrogenase [Bacillus altitudinis]|uniref:glutamate-5-semialdehyde dehydrogenase n=1 Tax=Bacillus altitudinis TaxID=293387 RepID=UPI0024A8D2C5|nr:glutamate-5-semialdehyde dehydrogenase [Bacillus altitudinis]MDI6646828.1 glutamate-5-semialdehyde dehydrogenase [Bacillus altitudinis]MDI6661449.1 glutamate-5-semialdehyde dehydrogenase [Bacillus altitudinis]
MNEVLEKAKKASAAKDQLLLKTTEQKNAALDAIAKALKASSAYLIAENHKDVQAAIDKEFTPSVIDRITLTEERIEAIADATHQLIQLKDPIGETLETIQKENGLFIEKVRVPLGTVGMIYEARPNVTVDAATLCLKTGNAVILRGSSSAIHSNKAIVKVIHEALQPTDIPVDSVQLIEDTGRETAKTLFTLNDYLDVLIPRGGKHLIDLVVRESTVPVLETGAGNCHIYIDETAQKEMSEQIVLNAKTQRPSVCNAIESIVIHETWAQEHGASLFEALQTHGVEIRGDEAVCAIAPSATLATTTDFETEFLAPIVSIKTVKTMEEAIQHIQMYSSKHSEAIITENDQHAALFLTAVDAAAVYHNASTRFTDGFEFGYGAEIGISTQKLHARGPMGLPALTSEKFVIRGQGQIRE